MSALHPLLERRWNELVRRAQRAGISGLVRAFDKPSRAGSQVRQLRGRMHARFRLYWEDEAWAIYVGPVCVVNSDWCSLPCDRSARKRGNARKRRRGWR